MLGLPIMPTSSGQDRGEEEVNFSNVQEDEDKYNFHDCRMIRTTSLFKNSRVMSRVRCHHCHRSSCSSLNISCATNFRFSLLMYAGEGLTILLSCAAYKI